MSLVKYNNNSISAVTSMASLTTGAMTLISEQTASSSASVSFTTGIDSTYPIYKFELINIHPSASARVLVNFRDGGSLFDAVKTTTLVSVYHNESGTLQSLGYQGAYDIAQGTGSQTVMFDMSTDNDASYSGELFLYNPSSTTFVKHFMFRGCGMESGSPNYAQTPFGAGYCNTTTAIDGVQFSMASGNIDSGTIKLYGIRDS
jgi:hypothetical protein